jgi:predicted nucleotidyltransferase
MTRLESALRALAGELSRLQRGIALVGGLAVSARAEPRLTRDVDLAVAVVDDADAETLIRQLAAAGYSAVAVVEQETVKRLASVRLATAAEGSSGIVADVLFASSGIEPEVVAAAEPVEVFPDLVVPVARVGHLVALKLLARDDRTRPQDVIDLHALFTVLDESDLERARQAVHAIEARGFARGRDLVRALEIWVQTEREG